MSIARHHAEWLSLVEVSGPFLSMPVLMRVFPQGLEAHDPERFRTLRAAYEEWQEDQGTGRFNPAIHVAWIKFILNGILELPDSVILEGQAVPQSLQATIAEQGETLRPDLVIKNPDGGPNAGKPRLLIQTYQPTQDLDKPVFGKTWKAAPGTRMMELLHATGIRLGLVTNGERWMLVDAPKGETTGFASWYANLWLEEQITFRAFRTLLNVERFFNVSDCDTLESLLAESAANQQEVTDQLGYQVRRAVEVLVQAIDRADQDHGRELLKDVSEAELYEAALTVMMRLVFLFCAEERGLLLLDDELYAQHYAVSTVREQLRETADQHGEEILERRHDAWCRLLSTFRVVYGGVEHDRMILPAYGGRLFDPDRFAFLEGRRKETSWRKTPCDPLPVNNRTVLHLLEALQILQVRVAGGGPAEARRLSFRALDIEQIGHVYEGLLDHTAKRATEPTLGLAGTRDREPEIALPKLEEMQAKGENAFIEFLKDQTGRSASALKKALTGELDLNQAQKLEAACGTDKQLWKRIQPFAALVRSDSFGYPIVIRTGSVYVTAGTDRRSSGTHYTPRSLTEPIVQYTLEPLVYEGPAEGRPKGEWKLRSPAELLDLKICDMACGSGAFLVQACRYMAERLVESWEQAEKVHPGVPGITPEGKPSTGTPGELLIPQEVDERLTCAQRVVAQRCIYGVDINPLAAEMAKLSLWLLTLAKDKPFTFLDHAIRCGDSLLGIYDLNQLKTFSLAGTGQQYVFGEQPLDKMVDEAIELRLKIESMPSNTAEDVEAQARLMADCEQRLEFLKSAADLLIAAELKGGNSGEKLQNRDDAAVQIGHYLKDGKPGQFRVSAAKELNGRRTLHWALEFPEILARKGGFDGVIGNPPFMGGQKISGHFGEDYRAYLVRHIADGLRGSTDLCAYMFVRAYSLLRDGGGLGLLATNTIAQGDTREVGLEQIVKAGACIHHAIKSRRWPGTAAVFYALCVIYRGSWAGAHLLDNQLVTGISTLLDEASCEQMPRRLPANDGLSYMGTQLHGMGFLLSVEESRALVAKEPESRTVLWPYLDGQTVNRSPTQSAEQTVINFTGMSEADARRFRKCFAIVEDRVKPFRLGLTQRNASAAARAKNWWRFSREVKELYDALDGHQRVLVVARVSRTLAFVFVRPRTVLNDKIIVFTRSDFGFFAALQSSLHTQWCWKYASTLKGDLNYSQTDCFETFPLPAFLPDECGQRYHEYRAEIMRAREEGLTATYNRFNNSKENTEDVLTLRELHAEIDKNVAAAYGWGDLDLAHDFHETKQGIRFTTSEAARREVLARLLKLNHERYAEEVAQGLHDKKRGSGSGTRGPRKGKAKPRQNDGPMLFGEVDSVQWIVDSGQKSADDPTPQRAPTTDHNPPSTPHHRPSTSHQSPATHPAPRGIEELEYNELIQAIRAVAASNGELPREDFLVAVARELGYARTGSTIHDAVDGAIRAAARRGIVETGFFGVARGKVKIDDWSRDDLVDALCSVMRKGCNYEREEAIKLAAAHLGFKRVGKNIDDAFRSAINGGIRCQAIGHEGNLIWREG